MRRRDRAAVALAVALLLIPLAPAQPARAETFTSVTVSPNPAALDSTIRITFTPTGAGGLAVPYGWDPMVTSYLVSVDGRVVHVITRTMYAYPGQTQIAAPQPPGAHQICVDANTFFPFSFGSGFQLRRVGCANLTVVAIPTTLSLSWPGPATIGAPSTAIARFTFQRSDGSSQPLSGQSISFGLGGAFFGAGTTDATGTARVTASVPVSVGTGTKPIQADCVSCNYLAAQFAIRPATGTLLVAAADRTPPFAPTLNVSATPVSWAATFGSTDNPGGSGVASYVYSVGFQGETTVPAAVTNLTGTVPGYAVPRPGTWFFMVRAVDKAGNSSGWASRQFTVPPRTPSLTLGNLPDPLRIGTRYAPTVRLFDPATAEYAGRPMGGREVRLTIGAVQAATRTDGAGNATFYGFSPGGSPGVQSGVLEFAGDVSGEVGPARVAFTRTVLPADRPPSPPTGLAARFITAAMTQLSWAAPAGGSSFTYYVRLNGGYEWATSGTSWQGLYQPGTYTLEVRARDTLGRFSDYARLTFTQPAAPTTLSNWVWSPAPARLGSFVVTRADLTWNLPASVYAQPGSGTLAGWPLTFALGSQTFGGTASAFSAQTVRAGPSTLPTSVTFAGSSYYAPARLSGTLVVLGDDATPPSVPVVTITPSVNTVNTFRVESASSDNAGGGGVQRWTYRIDGGAELTGATVSPSQPNSRWIWTNLAAPAPGVHAFQARAVDAAGNASAFSSPASFEWRRGVARWSTSTTVQSACSGGTPVGTVTVRGVLLDQDGKPLAGRAVTITGGGLTNSAATAADGSVTFSGRTGTSFTLSYAGETNYAAAATQVTAPPQPPCATPSPTPQPTPPPTAPPPSAPPSYPYTVDIPPS